MPSSGAGVFLNLVDQALIKHYGKGEDLVASNQPFPFTAKFRKLADRCVNTMLTASTLWDPFCFQLFGS